MCIPIQPITFGLNKLAAPCKKMVTVVHRARFYFIKNHVVLEMHIQK